jgi:hypothetical protein
MIVRALFKRLFRLTEAEDTPAWTLQVWDDDAQLWRWIGPSPRQPVMIGTGDGQAVLISLTNTQYFSLLTGD